MKDNVKLGIAENKRDFVNKLKDPVIGDVEQQFLRLQNRLRAIGWTAVMYGGAPGLRRLVIDHDINVDTYGSMGDATKILRDNFIKTPRIQSNDVKVRLSNERPRHKGVEMRFDITWEQPTA